MSTELLESLPLCAAPVWIAETAAAREVYVRYAYRQRSENECIHVSESILMRI